MAIEQLMQAVIAATPAKRRELERVLRGETTTNRDNDKHESRLVTIAGAARILALGRNTVYKLIMTGRLDTVDLNCCKRITMRSIQAFINSERPANEKSAELVAASRARYAENKYASRKRGVTMNVNDLPTYFTVSMPDGCPAVAAEMPETRMCRVQGIYANRGRWTTGDLAPSLRASAPPVLAGQ